MAMHVFTGLIFEFNHLHLDLKRIRRNYYNWTHQLLIKLFYIGVHFLLIHATPYIMTRLEKNSYYSQPAFPLRGKPKRNISINVTLAKSFI